MKIDGAKVQFGHISVSFLHIIVRADLKHCHKSYGVIKELDDQNINFWQTERKGPTGEYWPEIVQGYLEVCDMALGQTFFILNLLSFANSGPYDKLPTNWWTDQNALICFKITLPHKDNL